MHQIGTLSLLNRDRAAYKCRHTEPGHTKDVTAAPRADCQKPRATVAGPKAAQSTAGRRWLTANRQPLPPTLVRRPPDGTSSTIRLDAGVESSGGGGLGQRRPPAQARGRVGARHFPDRTLLWAPPPAPRAVSCPVHVTHLRLFSEGDTTDSSMVGGNDGTISAKSPFL